MTVRLIVFIVICWYVIPDSAFTALQYLVVEYCERNQWGRSWGETTSQEPWFWQDISWASGFEDNHCGKNFHLSWWKLLALYFGCCYFQQHCITDENSWCFISQCFLGHIFLFFLWILVVFYFEVSVGWNSRIMINDLFYYFWFSFTSMSISFHLFLLFFSFFSPFRFSTGLMNCVKSWVSAFNLTWTKTNVLRTHWLCMLEHIRWLFCDWSVHNSFHSDKFVHLHYLWMIGFLYPLHQWFYSTSILFKFFSCRQGILIRIKSSLLSLVL